MKRTLLLVAAIVISYAAYGQYTTKPVFGHIDTLQSTILDEDRRIFVFLPEEFSGGKYTDKTYPVLYLLDAGVQFEMTVSVMRFLNDARGTVVLPKMIVVGITNTNRTRDLTPTKGIASDIPEIPEQILEMSGGGEKFMDFIEQELIPYVEKEYPTAPHRTFAGHSFGGLTAMHLFIHRPELFDFYIAMDPALYWTGSKLIEDCERMSFGKEYEGKSLFVSSASPGIEGVHFENGQEDQTSASMILRSCIRMDEIFKSRNLPFRYELQYYPDDNHMTVPMITVYDGLRHIFDFYRFEFSYGDVMVEEQIPFHKYQANCDLISDKMGFEVDPDEGLINDLGYELHWMGEKKKAEEVFKFNIEVYPRSYNAFDSLGDFYRMNGDTTRAIESYNQSLTLNPESYSKEKLAKLQK